MEDVVALECPKCGASLKPAPGATTITCSYCGTTVEVEGAARPPAPPSPPPHPAPSGQPPSMDRHGAETASDVFRRNHPGQGQGQRRRRRLTVAGPVVVVLGAAAAWFVLTAPLVDGSRAAGALHRLSYIFSNVQADDAGVPVIGRGHDGRQVLVVRSHESTSTGGRPVVLMGYALDSLSTLWTTTSLGTDERPVKVAAAGGRVVASDAKGRLHVYDVGTGRVLKTLFLPDLVNELCAPASGRPEVWALTADKAGHLVDLATGKVTDAPRPATCVAPCNTGPAWAQDGERCAHLSLVPKDLPVSVSRVVPTPKALVVLGDRQQGTAVPVAYGLDPTTKAVLWHRTIPGGDPFAAQAGQDIDLAAAGDGAVYTVVAMKTGSPRLIALDPATGNLRWKGELPGTDRHEMDFAHLAFAGHRLYVARVPRLDVFDARTGAHVGAVGQTW